MSSTNPKEDQEDIDMKMRIAKHCYKLCYKQCLAQKGPSSSITKPEDLAASLSGYTMKSIKQLLKHAKKPAPDLSLLEPPDYKIDLHKVIHELYLVKRKVPTCKNIAENIQGSVLTPQSIKKYLRQCGYSWQKLYNTDKRIIVENEEFVKSRYEYLKKLELCRSEKKTIVYIEALKLPKESNANGDEVVYMVPSPEIGLIMTNTYSKITEDFFETWVLDEVLFHLPKNCVLIFDNNNFTRSKIISCKKPEKSNTKAAMIAYLKDLDIPHTPDMHRSELYELIEKSGPEKPTKYKLDEILRNNNITVIRRPCWLYDCNIFNFIFNEIKQAIIRNRIEKNFKINPNQSLTQTLIETISHIDVEKWKAFDKSVASYEKQCLKDDIEMENLIEGMMMMTRDGKFDDGDCAEDFETNESILPNILPL